MQFNVIGPDPIIQANELITGRICESELKSRLAACLSSYFYYNNLREMIASIVLSLVKGHFFVDGNKRTALVVFATLCELNKLEIVQNDEDLAKLFVKIAESSKDVAECCALLFSC